MSVKQRLRVLAEMTVSIYASILKRQPQTSERRPTREEIQERERQAALWALGQIGGEKAQEILQRFCEVDSEATRAAAEAALDELEFMHGDLTDFFARLAGESDLT